MHVHLFALPMAHAKLIVYNWFRFEIALPVISSSQKGNPHQIFLSAKIRPCQLCNHFVLYQQ